MTSRAPLLFFSVRPCFHRRYRLVKWRRRGEEISESIFFGEEGHICCHHPFFPIFTSEGILLPSPSFSVPHITVASHHLAPPPPSLISPPLPLSSFFASYAGGHIISYNRSRGNSTIQRIKCLLECRPQHPSFLTCPQDFCCWSVPSTVLWHRSRLGLSRFHRSISKIRRDPG